MHQNHFFYSWITLSFKSGMRIIARFGPDILVIVMISAICAWVHSGLSIPFTKDEVNLKTAQSWGDSVLWIDARSISDYEAEHIPGAVPLNLYNWKKDIATVRAVHIHKKKIVVYCYSARCNSAAKVARRLRKEMGLQNVVVMHGGWETWKKEHP